MNMQNLKDPIVIIALNSGRSWSDETMLIKRWFADRNLPVARLSGVYQGQQEKAYMVTLPVDLKARTTMLEGLQDLAQIYNQECILYSDEYRATSWISTTLKSWGQSLTLGKLHRVTKAAAHKAGCYSFEPQSRTYWSV